MTRRFGTLGTLGILGTALLLEGCGHGGAREPSRSAPEATAPAGDGHVYAEQSASAPGQPSYGQAETQGSMPAPAATPRGGMAEKSRAAESEGAADEAARPGLGTSWGEARTSHVSSTAFSRADYDRPFASASFLYNDDRGVEAMTRGRSLDWTSSVARLEGRITVSLTTPDGEPLRAARVGSRNYAVGHDGDRYVIHVQNGSPFRIEAVASVDGLDVIDGSDGDVGKRGYVIAPHDSLDIEGFRESQGTVRSFRFGATSDSYAARVGKGRNVGVIGVAIFDERGSDWRWTSDEIDRRETANPFPARFAPPPPRGF